MQTKAPSHPTITPRLAHAIRASALISALSACSSDPPVVTIDVITGHETDTFSQEPAVTRVDITATSAEGDIQLSASAPPGGTFDFGEIPQDRLLRFEVTGVDATGAVVVRGRTHTGIYLAAVSGGAIPIFVQRVNQWARPPGSLVRAHADAPAAVLAERYLMITGGSAATGADGAVDPSASDFYDLFAYGGSIGAAMPHVARSIVARRSAALVVGDAGAAWVDFDTGQYADAPLPAGLASFADVAGGRTVEAPDGRSFIVGATRRQGPTAQVLAVAIDGSLTALALSRPRVGAAAAWLEGAGLVVAGGSAEGPGLEVLGTAATGFAPRDFPPDAVEGAGAVVADPERLALIGGLEGSTAAPTRLIRPSCSSMCAAEIIDGAAIPVALTNLDAFSIGGGRAIAVGEATDGDKLMRSFLVGLVTPSATEVPLRAPRRGASLVPAPNGTLGLLGGVHADGSPALAVEMLFPQ